MMKRFVLSCLVSLAVGSLLSPAEAAPQKPNVILIFTDDQGYGDVGCYGAKGFKTPNLDRLAADGVRFTDFYVNCPVCSGSRTALLTGCHYQRLSMQPVLFPNSKYGLHPDEVTIAEVLKQQGYATACIGKWHLGHMPPCLPTMQGFDYYFGIPYSNDMTIDPRAPLSKNIVLREGMTVEKIRTGKPIRNKVPLMRGEEVIEYPVDQDTLTRRYTEETIRFIRQHKDEPFFVYLPHTMPHLPLHVSKEFAGRTKTKFGDIMEEIDWSVGEIVKAIADLKLDDKTLIIFTTDNGTRSGSSGPLRGRKASVYEGGIRVPCIMRWKGQIPAGKVCSEVAATIDILPTLAHLTGAELPKRKIDGKNIWPLMKGDPGAKSPHDVYCLAHGRGAVRSGKWKYYPADKQAKAELYDLEKDLSETTNVADQHPEVVKRLQASYEAHVADLRKNRRPAALLKRPELK